MLLVPFQVSLPNMRCLDVPDALIDKLISKLIINSMSEFGLNGHLRPILHACVASLIMYVRDVVRDFNKKNRDGTRTQFIHAKLCQ
jgi:hypothetical protein